MRHLPSSGAQGWHVLAVTVREVPAAGSRAVERVQAAGAPSSAGGTPRPQDDPAGPSRPGDGQSRLLCCAGVRWPLVAGLDCAINDVA